MRLLNEQEINNIEELVEDAVFSGQETDDKLLSIAKAQQRLDKQSVDKFDKTMRDFYTTKDGYISIPVDDWTKHIEQLKESE